MRCQNYDVPRLISCLCCWCRDRFTSGEWVGTTRRTGIIVGAICCTDWYPPEWCPGSLKHHSSLTWPGVSSTATLGTKGTEQAALLHAAKTYILQECGSLPASLEPSAHTDDGDSRSPAPSALGRFRFLSSKLKAQEATASLTDSSATQLARYMTEAAEAGDVNGIEFWASRKTTYTVLCHLLKISLLLLHRRLMWKGFFVVLWAADGWAA